MEGAESLPSGKTTEQRLTEVEDRLAIYNLIAGHPPIVDTQDMEMMKAMFAEGGVLDRGRILGSVVVDALPDGADPLMVSAAQDFGLCHLNGLPYLILKDGAAVAISYVAAAVREPFGEMIPVPAHGEGRGHRVFRITANRWDLVKQSGRWVVHRRTLHLLDGSSPARELIREALHG